MPTITFGGGDLQVYAILATANVHFTQAAHGAAWLLLSGNARIQALITSTNMIEREVWLGTPTLPVDPTKTIPVPGGFQELAFPRVGIQDRNGVAVSSSVIPLDMITGAIELAYEVAITPATQTDDVRGSNLKAEKVTSRVEGAVTKSTENQYFSSTLGRLPRYPRIAMDYFAAYLGSGAAGRLSTAPGVSEVSPLDGAGGSFGLTGPV